MSARPSELLHRYAAWLAGAAGVAAYAAAFWLLYPVAGLSSAALCVALVGAAAWWRGPWAGVAAALGCMALNTLLFNLAGVEPGGWLVILGSGSAPGALVTVLLGYGLGRLRELVARERRQREELQQAEARYERFIHDAPIGIF